MIRVVSQRVGATFVTLLVVLVVVFSLQQLVPGDPATAIAGESATPELLAQLRKELNLNQPFLAQLVAYVWDVVRLDLGTSTQSGQDVSQLLAEAIPVSVSLALVAFAFSLLIAIPVGTLAALRAGSWLDRLLTNTSAVALAIPPFVTGLLLQQVFAVQLGWFPAIGYVSITTDPGLWLLSLILPGLTIATLSAAELARHLRGTLIDTLEQDYIRTMRAKGISDMVILCKHAFRNAAAPMLTVLGIQMGQIISGTVIIESVFALPGVGYAGVNAIMSKDFPVVRGVVLFGAVMVIGMNLIVDLVNAQLNPRISQR